MDEEILVDIVTALEKDILHWKEQLSDIEARRWRLHINSEDVTEQTAERIKQDIFEHERLIARYNSRTTR